MTQLITRRRAGAGVAVGALVASALVLAPSGAQAALADVRESQIAPTATPYAGWHQDVSGGQYKVTNDGLELTGESDVIRGYTNNTSDNLGPTNGNVADLSVLGSSKVTVVSGSVKLKVAIYSTAIADDKLTTLSPVDAASGQWTSTDAIGEGSDAVEADTPTDLSAIIAAIGPNYRVKGFGVSNTTGTSVVSKIDFNEDTYTFKNNAPTVSDRTVSTKVNTPVSISLAATDVDGNELTYTPTAVVGGAVSGTGSTLTYTPAANFTGNGSVAYTVTDGRGGQASATITVAVSKARGKVTIYRIHPSRPSVRSTVYVYASIQVDGKPATAGTTVYGYAKGKKVVTAKVNSTGKVKLKLPNKLPAGKATLKVAQVGSSKLIGDSDSVAVRVRK
jgi:hypothetical protein